MVKYSLCAVCVQGMVVSRQLLIHLPYDINTALDLLKVLLQHASFTDVHKFNMRLSLKMTPFN